MYANEEIRHDEGVVPGCGGRAPAIDRLAVCYVHPPRCGERVVGAVCEDRGVCPWRNISLVNKRVRIRWGKQRREESNQDEGQNDHHADPSEYRGQTSSLLQERKEHPSEDRMRGDQSAERIS